MNSSATTPGDFLRAILADPDADAPRLVYADWLDERGDPRGEFVRVQCLLAKLPLRDPRRVDLERRERELLARHREGWEAPVRPFVEACGFRRGLIEFARLDARRFLERGEQLFDAAPIRHLDLLDVGGRLAALARCPQLSRLEALTAYACHQPAIPRALAASPHLSRLRRLQLGRNGIDDFGAAALAGSPHLAGLRSLDLAENGLTAAGARDLAASPHLAGLEALDLSANRLGPAGAEAIVLGFPQLRRLALRHNHLPGERAARLLLGTALERLDALDIAANDLGDATARALAEAPPLRLRALDLGHTGLTDPGLRDLARARMPGLRALALTGNQLGDAAITALVHAPWCEQLDALDLRHNPFGDLGVAALVASPHLDGLAWLDLSPGPGLVRRLRERFGERCRF